MRHLHACIVLFIVSLGFCSAVALWCGYQLGRREHAKRDANSTKLMVGTAMGVRRALENGQFESAEAGVGTIVKNLFITWQEQVGDGADTKLKELRISEAAHDRFFLEAADELMSVQPEDQGQQ